MKLVASFIFIIMNLYASYCQESNKYYIKSINPTKISQYPEQLKVIDTVDHHSEIYEAEFELGGLKPHYPIAKTYEHLDYAVIDYVVCLRTDLYSNCYNYLVQVDSIIIEINNPEKFKKIFAPVEDKEEALSFAYALSGILRPRVIYDFKFLKYSDYTIYRKELVPTSVKELTDGYEVILFSSWNGEWWESVIFVSKDGDVRELKTERLFTDKNNKVIE